MSDPKPVTMSGDEKQAQRSSTESSHISADNAEKATPASNNTAPVAPDGGTTAWLVVLGAWCTAFCSFGWLNSMFLAATVTGLYVLMFLQVSVFSNNITKRHFFFITPRVLSHGSHLCKFSLFWAWYVEQRETLCSSFTYTPRVPLSAHCLIAMAHDGLC